MKSHSLRFRAMLDEKIAFIILNYNCFKDTIKCLQNLLSFGQGFHIILVDNQSTDDSFEQLDSFVKDKPQIDLICSDKNGGYSYGNNYGIKFAIDKYNPQTVAIINPDVILPLREDIDKMIYYLWSYEDVAMIGGNPIENHSFRISSSSWDIPSKKEVFLERLLLRSGKREGRLHMLNDELAEVECLVGCFFLIKTSIFKSIGFFDEGVFLYNEENILGIKLKKAGYRALLAVRMFYYHNHDYGRENFQDSLGKKINKLKIRYKSRKYLIQKYYPSYLVSGLFLVECVNALQIILGHLKHKLLKK